MSPNPLRSATRTWLHQWDVVTRHRSAWRQLTASQLFVSSFALLIAFGTLGLKLIPGLYTGRELGWLDALFTATSAVCVTGLSVVDTATFFTSAGQAWILLLIQLGGLGIVAFTTLVIVALGKRLSLRQEALVARATDIAPHVDFRRLARDVILFTLALEAVGALLLYALWIPRFGWHGAAWPALFHSISAFCNAGFSTFSDSLTGFQSSPLSLLVISALVVLGGIGFLTLEELTLGYQSLRRGERVRLSLQSRLVLATTTTLLLAGWILFAFFEWHHGLRPLALADKLSNSLFLSITPRTAGFNTLDYSELTLRSNFLTILLMMVGGSPGSTAGGVKTTTFALIGLLAWTRFRGRDGATLWHRSLPQESLHRAVGLFVIACATLTISIFLYTTAEPTSTLGDGGFLRYAFEAVSAFNTVGLTLNTTPSLSDAGRWITLSLMFLGRVGPLTFAAAIALNRPTGKRELRYAHEDVVVG